MPSRRSYLRLSAFGLAGGVAGCLGRPRERGASTDPLTRTPTQTPTHTYVEPPAGPVRCRGDLVSVEQTLTDAPGYEDNVEYFPSNRTVRIVMARGPDGPASFETMPFEEWASIECAEVALERVRTATAERLGTDEFGSGIGRPPESASVDGLVVRLSLTHGERDGETVTPTVPLARFADVAPRSAEATVSLKGNEYARSVPVFAETSGPIQW